MGTTEHYEHQQGSPRQKQSENTSAVNSSNSYFVPRPILDREALYGLAGNVIGAILSAFRSR